MRLIVAATRDMKIRRSTNGTFDGPHTISIMGAGNCQDIDLAALANLFVEIRLVDIDAEAVNIVVSNCNAVVASRICVVAPVDIAAPLLTDFAASKDCSESGTAFVAALEAVAFGNQIPMSDVVVSTCLLSQLLDTASQIVSPDAAEFVPFIQAIRRGHLARLLESTAAGGRTILITDLVSSDTVPELSHTSPHDMPKLMFECLQSRNFFSGLSPAVVQNDLQTIPALMSRCQSYQILPPWLWQLGERSFGVYAVDMVRSEGSSRE